MKRFWLRLKLTIENRNKSANFSYLYLGTRLILRVFFPLFKINITVSPKIFNQNFADLIWIAMKDK